MKYTGTSQKKTRADDEEKKILEEQGGMIEMICTATLQLLKIGPSQTTQQRQQPTASRDSHQVRIERAKTSPCL